MAFPALPGLPLESTSVGSMHARLRDLVNYIQRVCAHVGHLLRPFHVASALSSDVDEGVQTRAANVDQLPRSSHGVGFVEVLILVLVTALAPVPQSSLLIVSVAAQRSCLGGTSSPATSSSA